MLNEGKMLENVYILKVIMLTRENQLTIYTCVFSVAQNFPYPNTTMKRTTRKQFSTLLTIKFTNEIECSTYHFLTSRRENWIETTIEKKNEKESIGRIGLNNTQRLWPSYFQAKCRCCRRYSIRDTLLNRIR